MCEVSKYTPNQSKKINAKIVAQSVEKDMTESYSEVLGSTDNSTFNEVLEKNDTDLKTFV